MSATLKLDPVADRVEVWRETDARRLNAILNHPKVRPWVESRPDQVLDVSDAVANPNNVCVMGEHGGVLFFKLMPGIYEVHTQVLPNGRGKWMMGMAHAAARYLYTHTDAVQVVTRVPVGHLAAQVATLAMGFRFEFRRPTEAWFKGKIVDVDIYHGGIADWIASAPELEERGAWFHDCLAAEATRLGITQTPHSNDSNHDRYVGAALEMAFAGQVMKGVAWYNRWALMSRHKIIQPVKGRSLLIRFDIGLLRITPDSVEVIPE